ncbi:hypothetical protein [Maribacter sp. 2304DJ31-5]|uniref:hypothetical protein n=1 Tax=Maribacter sp. 2304DJ31-5 TaxID=3386273 RepID=UPI0039BD6D95
MVLFNITVRENRTTFSTTDAKLVKKTIDGYNVVAKKENVGQYLSFRTSLSVSLLPTCRKAGAFQKVPRLDKF